MKDHCTGFFEKIGSIDISTCCKNHDRDYLIDGVMFIYFGLAIALSWLLFVGVWSWWLILIPPLLFKFTFDWKLFICVSKTGKYMFIIAFLMFIAVSLLGWLFWIPAQIKRLFTKG